MPLLVPTEILGWTGGRPIGMVQECTRVFTDTRQPTSGGLFVALEGEHFDGHRFVHVAASTGAAGALVAESHAASLSEELATVLTANRFFLVVVPNTLKGLHDLARGVRHRFSGPVIGVTGSNGKTTTKEMIAAALGRQLRVLATKRNFNNEIGLPLTLLQLEDTYGACVVEMAMRGLGQITELAAVAEPVVGVVTNVGPVHLESLGSIDNVACAKRELIVSLPTQGAAVLNCDDTRVLRMKEATRARVITFGRSPDALVQARKVEILPQGSRFALWIEGRFVADAQVGLPGMHNVSNALAALAATWACGLDPARGAAALAGLTRTPMRLEISDLPSGVVLINDAYNASPLSMQAALAVLAGLDCSGRRVAVLGDMLELGAEHERRHRKVGELAVVKGVDLLVTVGDGGRLIGTGALDAGLARGNVIAFEDGVAAAAAVTDWLRRGDCVLVKASRGMRLEQVAEAVAAAVHAVE